MIPSFTLEGHIDKQTLSDRVTVLSQFSLLKPLVDQTAMAPSLGRASGSPPLVLVLRGLLWSPVLTVHSLPKCSHPLLWPGMPPLG